MSDMCKKINEWLDNCLSFNRDNTEWVAKVRQSPDYRHRGIAVLLKLRKCQIELYQSALEHKDKEQILFSDFMAMMITAQSAQQDFIWWRLWVCYFISLGRGQWQQLWADVDNMILEESKCQVAVI